MNANIEQLESKLAEVEARIAPLWAAYNAAEEERKNTLAAWGSVYDEKQSLLAQIKVERMIEERMAKSV